MYRLLCPCSSYIKAFLAVRSRLLASSTSEISGRCGPYAGAAAAAADDDDDNDDDRWIV